MPLSAAVDCEAFHTEVVLGKDLNELPFLVDVSVTVFSKRSWAVVLADVLERWDGGRLSVKLLVYNAAECRYLGPGFPPLQTLLALGLVAYVSHLGCRTLGEGVVI